MRILHLLNHCNHGHGNAHVAVDLATVQAAGGHDVTYASAGGDYEPLLKSSGVRIAAVVLKPLNPARATIAIYRLLRVCRQVRPQVIHAHMMAGALVGYVVSRLTGIPLVTTVHNSFDWHSTLMRLGDRIVAVSQAERRALETRGFPTARLRVVLNGPNLSPRDQQERAGAPAPAISLPCITTVCGLHPRKGVLDLLRGFAQASAQQPGWTLYIIGDGPDRDQLCAQARELLPADAVVFAGNVANPKRVLDESDIFVLASYADPCSLAVAEARYAGCAVIATAVGGTPELLGQGEHGLLVAPGRPDEIADALLRLMSDPDELRVWRDRAGKDARYLTIARVCEDYQRVYDEIVL
ncbi:glycosyltransferase family 4 protein [Methylobacterium sp. GXS13]|uniref:glycosyltransferase family 4 protein n=1 Tax=Methylobacterium sp. GXS13 TaxID=1730094 RepID=UPI000A5C5734|nr:glycosyltransferase family 4 protein [Methylobacterium sp. GXS13]